MSGKEFPKRGEIYWVNLDPSVGSETKKIRPGIVVSNNIGNEFSNVVMIAPITSKIKNVHPFEVEIVLNNKPGKIMLNQCRAIDKSRLLDKIIEIDPKIMRAIEDAIRIVFSLN